MPTGIGTTSTLPNSVRIQYLPDYMGGVMAGRVYDPYAQPVPGDMRELMKGSAVQVNFLSDLPPSTQTVSQSTDITPRRFIDATATITPTSRHDAVEDSELLLAIQAYTNYAAKRMEKLGKQQMESVELLAQAACLQGTNVYRAAVRASLDAGTHRLTDTIFTIAQRKLQARHAPGWVGGENPGMTRPDWFATMHTDVYYDILLGGNVVTIGQQQQAEILLNNVMGSLGGFRIVADPRAKVFGGAGADNASAVATTVSTAVAELDKTFAVAAATNMVVGMELTVGTEETGDTHYETNEIVQIASISGTDITIIGAGDNGGFRLAHAAGVAVRNADHAYPVVFGGPASIAKLYATNMLLDGAEVSAGPYGIMVPPHSYGINHQWATAGWKFYGGYGRWNEGWLLRAEVASSVQA